MSNHSEKILPSFECDITQRQIPTYKIFYFYKFYSDDVPTIRAHLLVLNWSRMNLLWLEAKSCGWIAPCMEHKEWRLSHTSWNHRVIEQWWKLRPIQLIYFRKCSHVHVEDRVLSVGPSPWRMPSRFYSEFRFRLT